MKLIWGNAGQLKFKDAQEYYMALGIFCNDKLSRIYLEDNAKRGSYSDAYRILIYSGARNLFLTPGIIDAMKTGGRINCNEYVENLLENHNFVMSGNTVIANLENVIKTIPVENSEYISAFMGGYSIANEEDNRITYSTISIDTSEALLVRKNVPSDNGPLRGKIRHKTGKRDYIKKAIDNFEIGEAGEKIVYEHEKRKLLIALKNGKVDSLENKLDWVSRYDDSQGYDIKSYDVENQEVMYIEVKTTTGNSLTPFFISDMELCKSEELDKNYYIYRLYNMNRRHPEQVDYYILQGDITRNEKLRIDSIGNEVSFLKK